MSYSIGVGLLLEDEPFNKVRQLELSLASETGNDSALRQPPHITVKRPFVIANQTELHQVIQVVTELAKKTGPIPIRFEGFGHFGNNVLYIQPLKNDQLALLHRQLTEQIGQNFENSVHELEQDKMVFHTTLGMNLTEADFEAGTRLIEKLDTTALSFSATATRLGIFMSIDDGLNWIVVAQIPIE